MTKLLEEAIEQLRELPKTSSELPLT